MMPVPAPCPGNQLGSMGTCAYDIHASAKLLNSSLLPLLPYRYHKVVKKGKAKKALKEFEQLRKVNPAAALEELEKIEKARMMVRLPLAPPPPL